MLHNRPHILIQESPAIPEILDLKAHPDLPAFPAKTDHPDHPAHQDRKDREVGVTKKSLKNFVVVYK